MRTILALSFLLSGVSAFVPVGFMGAAVQSKAAVSDSRLQMVFGIGGAGSKKSKAASVKAAAKIQSKPKPVGPDYLRTPTPGVGPQGAWFVRADPTLSTALPWVTKPEIGDGSLVGDNGFDPWGLAKIFDVNWLRSSELKHGRVAMLAALGLIVPELVQKPSGFQGFSFAPEFTTLNGISALGTVPKFGLAQIALVLSIIEIATFGRMYNEKFNFDDNLSPLEREKVLAGKFDDLVGGAKVAAKSGVSPFAGTSAGYQEPEKIVPGDLGFDPLGLADNGVNPRYALSEIKHARLAMIGVAGMLIQASLEQDKGILEQTSAWIAGQSA